MRGVMESARIACFCTVQQMCPGASLSRVSSYTCTSRSCVCGTAIGAHGITLGLLLHARSGYRRWSSPTRAACAICTKS